MNEVPCEACDKMVDADDPATLKGMHYICLDCQVKILTNSLASASMLKSIQESQEEEDDEMYHFLREDAEKHGEPLNDEVIRGSERFKSRMAANEASRRTDENLMPYARPGYGFEKSVLYVLVANLGFISIAFAGWKCAPALAWIVCFPQIAKRLPRRWWSSDSGQTAFYGLWCFGAMVFWLFCLSVVRFKNPTL